MNPLDNLKMELLQCAYVEAVAATVGKSCEVATRDKGIDLRVVDWIQEEDGDYSIDDGGVLFNCQLKASTRSEVVNGELVFPMKVRDFNRLATWKGIGIKILVAFKLPRDPGEWFSQTQDIMCLRHCCYWRELTGEQPSPNKPGSTKHVRIPTESVFDSQTVMELTERARRDLRS